MVKLSPREQEVLIHFLRCGRLKQVAADLHIAENTVWTFKKEAMRKLGVDNNVDLIRVAIRRGLIEA